MATMLPKLSFEKFILAFEQSRALKECMTVGKIKSVTILGRQCRIIIGDPSCSLQCAFEVMAHGEQFLISTDNKDSYIGQYVLLSYTEKSGRVSFHYFTAHKEQLIAEDPATPFSEDYVKAFEASVDEDNVKLVYKKKGAYKYVRFRQLKCIILTMVRIVRRKRRKREHMYQLVTK